MIVGKYSIFAGSRAIKTQQLVVDGLPVRNILYLINASTKWKRSHSLYKPRYHGEVGHGVRICPENPPRNVQRIYCHRCVVFLRACRCMRPNSGVTAAGHGASLWPWPGWRPRHPIRWVP